MGLVENMVLLMAERTWRTNWLLLQLKQLKNHLKVTWAKDFQSYGKWIGIFKSCLSLDVGIMDCVATCTCINLERTKGEQDRWFPFTNVPLTISLANQSLIVCCLQQWRKLCSQFGKVSKGCNAPTHIQCNRAFINILHWNRKDTARHLDIWFLLQWIRFKI